MSSLEPSVAAKHAREFWGNRYQTFALSESGWMGAGEIYNGYLYECKRQALMRALEQIGVNVNSSVEVLDAGCGQGFFVAMWRRDFPGATYAGIDICDKVVVHLKSTFPWSEFFAGDLASWQHPRGKKFDIIHSFEVLHLLLSDAAVEGAICSLSAQLKAGGYLLLTAVMPEEAVEPNEYIRHQGRAFWATVFRKAELELVSVNRMYYWLPDGGPKNRVASKILRLSGPALLYGLDRCAHWLRLPQVVRSWDSRMKLLVLKAVGTRSTNVTAISPSGAS